MRRRRPLPQDHQHHRHLRLLDRIDQRLPQPEQLRLLSDVPDVDPRRVLEPDDRDPIPTALRHELVHLDQALPIQLAAHGAVFVGVLRVVRQQTLPVPDHPQQEAVHLHQARVYLGAVRRTEFHVLRVVRKTSQDVVEIIACLRIHRNDRHDLLRGVLRLRRRRHTEETRMVCRHLRHVPFQRIQHLRLLLEDGSKKSRLVVMDLHASGRHRLEVACRRNQLLGALLVKVPLRAHSADDSTPAHGDVRFLVCEKDRRADPLVAAARRIGPVDPRQHRDSHLLQLCVPEEAGSLAAAVRIDLLLLRQLHARTVHQPHQRQVHDLCQIRHPQVVVRLAGNPRSGDPLVVEADQYAPFPADPRQAVHNPGAPRLLVLRVVNRVQRAERPGIDHILNPLPHGHLAPFVDHIGRDPEILDAIDLGIDLLHDRLGLLDVCLHPLNLRRAQRLPYIVHLRKIWSHLSNPSSFVVFDRTPDPSRGASAHRYRFALRIPN